jgi:thioesterase domain-containing protein
MNYFEDAHDLKVMVAALRRVLELMAHSSAQRRSDLRAKFDLLEAWQSLALGSMAVREVPGTHLDMIKEPHVKELAKKLDQCLLRARQRDIRTTSRTTPQPTANQPRRNTS